ncbi:MAG: serine--tRNA ligase, partial [Acidobacteriota bacterium]
MLDPAYVRDHLDDVRAGLERRGLNVDAELATLSELETRRRQLIPELEELRRQQNASGEEAARARRDGRDPSEIFAASKARAQLIKEREAVVDQLEGERRTVLLTLPNLPHSSVPFGSGAADNREVRRHGEPPSFAFTPKAHWDLGPALGIIDFERATKISGARFSVL